jgi:hypothetical protein
VPLDTSNFHAQGPVKSTDLMQFYNLFTGVMTDQPVAHSNSVAVGGNQGLTTVPLRVYGAVGQNTNLIDLYADKTQAQPGFGLSAAGRFGWGPGGISPQDTFLSRIGIQSGPTDTPGLFIAPSLTVNGTLTLQAGSLAFSTGQVIGASGTTLTTINPSLQVGTTLYVGNPADASITRTRVGQLNVTNTLLINGADAVGAGYTAAQAHLQIKADTLGDPVNSSVNGLSVWTTTPNASQFNVRFVRQTAGNAWPGAALVLAYDVDSSLGIAGSITFLNGRIGIDVMPNPAGATLQVGGSITATTIAATGAVTIAGDLGVTGSLTVSTNATVTGTLTVSGAIGTASIASNDWFRVNTAGDGVFNNVTSQGIGLPVGGATLYPSNDPIVGINATQTLANKTLSSPTLNSATSNSPTINNPTLAGGVSGQPGWVSAQNFPSGTTINGQAFLGQGAIPTNSTTGFPFITLMGGAPTGAVTGGGGGRTAIVWDSTNRRIWAYDSSWHYVQFT